MRHFRYVIIGNSAAGIAGYEGLRQIDASGSVAIISDEAAPIYSRSLISYYLAGQIGEEGTHTLVVLESLRHGGIELVPQSLRLDSLFDHLSNGKFLHPHLRYLHSTVVSTLSLHTPSGNAGECNEKPRCRETFAFP